MEQSPTWEANSLVAGEETFRNLKVHYRARYPSSELDKFGPQK
jgi:hypothetical protein